MGTRLLEVCWSFGVESWLFVEPLVVRRERIDKDLAPVSSEADEIALLSTLSPVLVEKAVQKTRDRMESNMAIDKRQR